MTLPVLFMTSLVGRFSNRSWPLRPQSAVTAKMVKLQAKQRESNETPEEFALRLRNDIAGNPDSYFQRTLIVRSDDELTQHRRDVWEHSSIDAPSTARGSPDTQHRRLHSFPVAVRVLPCLRRRGNA